MHPVTVNLEKLGRIIADVPVGRYDLIIPALQNVQEESGYIPESIVFDLAKQVGTTPAKIFGVATFYNQFRLTPQGKHTIRICRGTACHVKGSRKILDALCHELGISSGETTADGIFTIEEVACLGSCSISPAVMIDDRFYGHMTTGGVLELIEAIRNGGTE